MGEEGGVEGQAASPRSSMVGVTLPLPASEEKDRGEVVEDRFMSRPFGRLGSGEDSTGDAVWCCS